ncbi:MULTISPECIES: LysR family transcriptional regulator [unclassified Crossiella]|uniref:LysR family transcriptional regulator n=1 Tax=unclassified Crossiella TaxID=2620835 RepID=UPI001FFED6BB|nr:MULTISPECIES: LysR substrate-binding domain-containing protein [unclassified Crossiella]MCK2241456.1 LysR substrate-binding domain-containing protein [Crossiella sp. S99.2]MCK2255672.1 LysR substrate-binding domain-containing protein [Crossiella sp. S99.1]
MDVDLRKLRYFVAVAEHLHFGRAAEALHIAQPVLSRQIRALEEELKVQLFRRDRRATELTPAGEQLLADARPLLAGAEALRRRVGRAARGDRFTVGFMPGLIVTAAVRELSRRHPELTVDVQRVEWTEQTAVIHDGRVDVCFVRQPIDPAGLTVRDLFLDPRAVLVPADHRLAGKETVEIADLADEHLLQVPAAVPEWRDQVGGGPSAGPVLRTMEEKLEHVAAGHGVVVLPMSAVSFYQRPDVTHIPITDLAPNRVCLAWDSTRRNPLLAEFAAIAAEV